jgi:hypothetical protein
VEEAVVEVQARNLLASEEVEVGVGGGLEMLEDSNASRLLPLLPHPEQSPPPAVLDSLRLLLEDLGSRLCVGISPDAYG